MKSKDDIKAQRILLLIKLDAKNLFQRVKQRQSEYIGIFALKRTREHFPTIFKNRFKFMTIAELAYCTDEVSVAVDTFYTLVDDMEWYFAHTEDMPNTIEDKVRSYVRDLSKHFKMLEFYIDAELETHNENPEPAHEMGEVPEVLPSSEES